MMTTEQVLIQTLGTLGVVLLLAAFVLNLLKKLTETSAAYLWLNIVGAVLSAVYALYSHAYPFVVLESVWGIAALVRLLSTKKRAS
ncbi:MAG: hypothetical protein WAU88_03535 [Candidatus Zixiibacteriota bacterium]